LLFCIHGKKKGELGIKDEFALNRMQKITKIKVLPIKGKPGSPGPYNESILQKISEARLIMYWGEMQNSSKTLTVIITNN